MTVKELIALLGTLDPDMPVITQRYSDYMDLDEPHVVKASRDKGGWRARFCETSNESAMECLYFNGN